MSGNVKKKTFSMFFDVTSLAGGGANIYTNIISRPFNDNVEVLKMFYSLSTIGGLPNTIPEIQVVLSEAELKYETWTSQKNEDFSQIIHHNWLSELPINKEVQFEENPDVNFWDRLFFNLMVINNDAGAFSKVIKAHFTFYYQYKGGRF